MRAVRAAVFEGMGKMPVREVGDPELRDGDALIRVHYCGICGSDVSLFKTGVLSGPDRVLGHEVLGVVEEDRATVHPPGTRVVAWPARGCGECVWCRDGFPRYCLHPSDWMGGYAERWAIESRYLLPVPEQLSDEVAVLAEPLGVGLRGIDEAEVSERDLAYVSGLGGIGLLVVAGLVARGARVIGADPREDRRELGMRFGCELVFDPLSEDPWWKTLAVDLHGPRFAFECSGAALAVQAAFNVCGHRGTVVLLGIPFEPAFFLPAVMSVKDQRALSVSGPTMETIEKGLELLARRPEIAEVVTAEVGLGDVERSMLELADGTGGLKVLVDPRR